MPEEDNKNSNIRVDDHSFAFGEIHVGGNVRDIHIGDTIGFTPEQVSTLITQVLTTSQLKPFDGRFRYEGLDFFSLFAKMETRQTHLQPI